MHPSVPQPGTPGRPARSAPSGFTGAGVVLVVTALTAALCSELPDVLTHQYSGDGEGEGPLGELKFYVSGQVQGAFLTLALVLLVAGLVCFAVALVRRLTSAR